MTNLLLYHNCIALCAFIGIIGAGVIFVIFVCLFIVDCYIGKPS